MAEDTKKGAGGKKETFGTGSLKAGEYEAEDVFEGAEEWSPVETKLVVWSFIAAAIALGIGGTLVNMYILK
jgi:hypothetical protein